MPTTATATFSTAPLQPILHPEDALMISVKIGPSLTLAKGTIMAELTASAGTFVAYAGSAVVAAPVSAPSLSDGGAGALGAGTYYVAYTYVNANGETTLSPVQNITISASHLITVAAVTPLPTNVASVNWYVSTAANAITMMLLSNNNGATFNITALPAAGSARYPIVNTAVAATDGSAGAKLILVYDVATDASSNVTLGAQTGGNEFGVTHLTTPCYFTGTFRASDLTGLDAAAVSQLGRLIEGPAYNSANAILRLR